MKRPDRALHAFGLVFVLAVATTLPKGNFTADGTGAKSRSFASKLGDTVSVKDFGAVGDGVADDASKINNAIGAFGASPACGEILLPGGTYNISSTIAFGARQGCILRGVGSGDDASSVPTMLKWTGSAGQPMVQIQGYGVTLSNLAFRTAGNKPSSAIEYSAVSTISGSRNNLYNIWIGDSAGALGQMSAGIAFLGTLLGDSNTFTSVHIYKTDIGVDNQNPNASDIHMDGLFISQSATGVHTFGRIVGTNWLITNSTITDLSIETGGVIDVHEYVSEVGFRMAVFAGGASSLVIRGGSWQATTSMANDGGGIGRFIDTGANTQVLVDLQDFILAHSSESVTPVMRLKNSGGGASAVFARLVGTQGIYSANIDIGSSLGQFDPHQLTYEPRPISGLDPVQTSHVILTQPKSADRTFQYRNDFAGKVNVYGGEMRVNQIPTPDGLACTPTGGSGTTYGYRVSGLTYGGETLSATEVTCSGGAVLSGTVFNTVAWNAVVGAIQYKVYGRTSGAELLMTTVTYDSAHAGKNDGSTFSFKDDGALTPSGALPAANTTGQLAVEGTVSAASGDNKGSVALSGGTKAITVMASGATICVCNDTTTIANPCKGTISGTTLTLTGTGTDTVSYLCL